MIRDSDDTLRQLGDRLDWVYPIEPSEALLEVIGPLFVREPGSADPAPAPAPPRPIRLAVRSRQSR